VVLLEGAAVTGLTRDGSDYRVTTPAGSLRVPRLVLAAGGWTAPLGAMLGARLPVSGAPLQMVVTECAPPMAPCLLAHAGRRLTMKQATAGNLIIGGAWTAATDPATGRTRVIPESLEGNLWTAERVLPAVAGLRVIRSWAAMNVDIDGAPMIGPIPGLPGAVAVASANGYTLGPLLGRYAAEIAVSGRAPQTLARFSPDRFAAPQ
jgi:glycine/D-amino acid oxidase-like deaminating enzyme